MSNDALKQTELTPDVQLKGIAYQLMKLHDRWSTDLQEVIKQSEELGKLLKTFKSEVNALTQLQPDLRERLAQSIGQVAKAMADHTAKALTSEVKEELNSLLFQFNQSLRESNEVLHRQHTEIKYNHWKVIGVSVVTTLISSLLIVKWLMPTPLLPLSAENAAYLVIGKQLSEKWYSLSDEERKHLRHLIGSPPALQYPDLEKD